MGELGWTEEQTLQTTMPSLLLAIEGRREMLRAIFGGGDVQVTSEPEVVALPMTPSLFRAVFCGKRK